MTTVIRTSVFYPHICT